MNKDFLKNLVKETLTEMKAEKTADRPAKKQRIRESLKSVIGQILKEYIASVNKPKKSKDDIEKERKGYAKDGNVHLDKTNEQLKDEMEKISNDIDKSIEVKWDDHGDLVVDAKELFKVRIHPMWDNNFYIESWPRLQDRVVAVGLDWEQVKNFVKANFKHDSEDIENTKVDQAKNKAMDHLEDESGKGEVPKQDYESRTTIKKVGDTKKDDKDYNKPDVEDDDDLPDQPMKPVDVDDIKKQSDHKEHKEEPQKHKDDKRHIKKMKIGRGRKRALN